MWKKTVINQSRFVTHLSSHDKPVPSSRPPPIHPNQRPFQHESNSTDSIQTEEEPKCLRNVKQQKSCPICQKEMDPRSIGRHCRAVHQEEVTPQSICMDLKKGIFMVRKSMSGGVAFPVHVRKMNWNREDSDEQSVFREHDPCMTYMYIARRSGMPAAECPHLRNVATSSVYKKGVTLNEDDLRDLSNTVLTKY